jgi:hypothetical protein
MDRILGDCGFPEDIKTIESLLREVLVADPTLPIPAKSGIPCFDITRIQTG